MHTTIYVIAIVIFTYLIANAGRVSRSQSESIPCPDRAVRVLVIGGELQPNTWCDPRNGGKHLGWSEHQNKVASERAEYERRNSEVRQKKARSDAESNASRAIAEQRKAQEKASRDSIAAEKKKTKAKK